MDLGLPSKNIYIDIDIVIVHTKCEQIRVIQLQPGFISDIDLLITPWSVGYVFQSVDKCTLAT